MSINNKPQICIKLLRDIKTDALLIYIKTVIEELLENIKTNNYKIDLGFEEFNKEIEKNIIELNEQLDKTIINAYELKSFMAYQQARQTNHKLLPNDEALVFYYNTIVKQIETYLLEGELWIPEQIILALLSEWILEEEKSTIFYSFLNNFDYIKLLGYYEVARNNEKNINLKNNILKMYQISSSMIKRLKNSKYKINSSRKSKMRKK
ncbi:hypothetical protein [Arcobacter caeni]|uniref:Uncharacterized protein n=1 Tax=Arcobacter caeni TaxID=1912877 RepID=A0A363CZA5_9BACT|nr:hypothetical protein [Arcobacter caeni]PUE64425.1 hypothetical protein B0174_06135 [Arcobacter caeni]